MGKCLYFRYFEHEFLKCQFLKRWRVLGACIDRWLDPSTLLCLSRKSKVLLLLLSLHRFAPLPHSPGRLLHPLCVPWFLLVRIRWRFATYTKKRSGKQRKTRSPSPNEKEAGAAQQLGEKLRMYVCAYFSTRAATDR